MLFSILFHKHKHFLAPVPVTVKYRKCVIILAKMEDQLEIILSPNQYECPLDKDMATDCTCKRECSQKYRDKLEAASKIHDEPTARRLAEKAIMTTHHRYWPKCHYLGGKIATTFYHLPENKKRLCRFEHKAVHDQRQSSYRPTARFMEKAIEQSRLMRQQERTKQDHTRVQERQLRLKKQNSYQRDLRKGLRKRLSSTQTGVSSHFL